ncbi:MULTISPECIES: hypothetical protein [unclassified Caballeronia]|uniref:hypothetical protein n=1 Tax=unclassified Caballeronia TaxID=2646786 RepID=UPI00285A4B94|nr:MULTISPECIES: hypothetical protein [unclassified Caballeronia]MDR5770866.1 hypothetical protein [Caballeronia sp. LZ002]MDR5846303.1 hypothetical protein [Caballeronia sp. LZ003]
MTTLWTLMKQLESTCPDLLPIQFAAFRAGLDAAASHLANDDDEESLACTHEREYLFFEKHYDSFTGRYLRPYFDAGFASLLVHADVSLDELRGQVEGWR